MSNVAIRVENLGKLYRIGGPQERYRTFRDTITDAVSAPFKRARSLMSGQAYGAAGLHEEIWALKDVSFEVKHGEVVGIIGRNGAGKSTLLKVLSRITEPTEGYVDIYGRVGSLLEVGTGFHPELTGRENIYLNGAILGMSREEIDRKFDEIVDFAGVERFIDTPVKHYSSGMGLRLGFSVAAHLEPEILVVDEVLAVGDAEFQKKCLGKMSDVAGEGRTVLFVSHNMAAVQSLTTRCILLEGGLVSKIDISQKTVEYYLSSAFHQQDYVVDMLPRSRHNLGTKMRISRILPRQSGDFGFYFGAPLVFEISIMCQASTEGLSFGVTVLDISGTPIFSAMSSGVIASSHSGRTEYCLTLADTRLAPGSYVLALSLFSGGLTEARTTYDLVNPAIVFHVAPFDANGEALVNWQKAYGPVVHQQLSVSKL